MDVMMKQMFRWMGRIFYLVNWQKAANLDNEFILNIYFEIKMYQKEIKYIYIKCLYDTDCHIKISVTWEFTTIVMCCWSNAFGKAKLILGFISCKIIEEISFCGNYDMRS